MFPKQLWTKLVNSLKKKNWRDWQEADRPALLAADIIY
jgi:hypothetical protein